MNKRQFLATSSAATLIPATQVLAQGQASPPADPASSPAGVGMPAPPRRLSGVLTLSGAVGKTNRGPFDPVADQLMKRQEVRFERAYEFDAAMLDQLPPLTIKPTLEYDAKRHTLQGPLLTSVLARAGVSLAPSTEVTLRAIDGYAVAVSVADIAAWRMIVATRIDGHPMALGGLGPQWAVYDADVIAAFKDRPVAERFGACPWGLYSIEVKG